MQFDPAQFRRGDLSGEPARDSRQALLKVIAEVSQLPWGSSHKRDALRLLQQHLKVLLESETGWSTFPFLRVTAMPCSPEGAYPLWHGRHQNGLVFLGRLLDASTPAAKLATRLRDVMIFDRLGTATERVELLDVGVAKYVSTDDYMTVDLMYLTQLTGPVDPGYVWSRLDMTGFHPHHAQVAQLARAAVDPAFATTLRVPVVTL